MKSYWKLLPPCLIAVPAFFVAAVAIYIGILIQQTPLYRSEAIIELPPPTETSINSYNIQLATHSRSLENVKILAQARDRLPRPISDASKLLKRVEATHMKGTSLIQLSALSSDPVFSADFVNAWAEVALNSLGGEEQEGYNLSQRGWPSIAPVSQRRVKSLFIAGCVGAGFGLIFAIILAGTIFIMKTNHGLESTGAPPAAQAPETHP